MEGSNSSKRIPQCIPKLSSEQLRFRSRPPCQSERFHRGTVAEVLGVGGRVFHKRLLLLDLATLPGALSNEPPPPVSGSFRRRGALALPQLRVPRQYHPCAAYIHAAPCCSDSPPTNPMLPRSTFQQTAVKRPRGGKKHEETSAISMS